MIMRRKSIFDIVREAEEDEVSSDTAQADTNQTENEAPAPEESGEDASNDDYGGEDDFDINADLDVEDDLAGGGDSGSDDSSSSSTNTSSASSTEEPEEPVEANTDIFASLSKEEQQIKISELKKLFANLYTSTDDILEKINNTDTDESNIEAINRVSMVLYTLRKYIVDYMENSFSFKSYIENDITYNRFLSILNSIASVLEDIAKENNKK